MYSYTCNVKEENRQKQPILKPRRVSYLKIAIFDFKKYL